MRVLAWGCGLRGPAPPPAPPHPLPPPAPPPPDTAAAAAGARSSSRPATPPPPPPAPPRPNPGLGAGAESAPGGEYATLPQPRLFSFEDPTTTLKKNPDLSCASPPFQPPAGPRGARGPRDPGVPRAAPNPGTILSLSRESSDPCLGSRGTPPSIPTPREIRGVGPPPPAP